MTHQKLIPKVLVSACLVGLCTRYDAKIKKNGPCLTAIKNTHWIPVCPEQLGGLATPREAASLIGGTGADVLEHKASVVTRTGMDVTTQFIHGAEQVLQLARQLQIKKAYLKAKSPSCGVHQVLGVTSALLQKHGIELIEF